MIQSHRLAAITGPTPIFLAPTFLALILTTLTLGACAGPAIPRPSTPPAVAAPAPTVVKPVQNNALIGSSADAIGRMFGKPRLDVTEGAGRKLQFAGSNCILDVYFYAPRVGADPVATHVDARTPDGRNAEVNSCAQSFQR